MCRISLGNAPVADAARFIRQTKPRLIGRENLTTGVRYSHSLINENHRPLGGQHYDLGSQHQ